MKRACNMKNYEKAMNLGEQTYIVKKKMLIWTRLFYFLQMKQK